MPHMPHAVSTTAAANYRAAGTRFSCRQMLAVTAPSDNGSAYIPLAQRTSDELQAKAEELRHMASTATTADVMKALLTLADRYAELAAKRRAGANA